jgi:hypothetical protein
LNHDASGSMDQETSSVSSDIKASTAASSIARA